MSTLRPGALRHSVRGVVASETRSCALQSSGKQITTAPAVRVPFAPDRARHERAAISIKVALTPSGVPVSTIFVQGTHLPGGSLPPGPATQRSYPIRQVSASSLSSRRVNRVLLPLAGDVPLFVATRGIAGAGSIEIE